MENKQIKDIENYVEQMIANSTQNAKIRKSVWSKKYEILISKNNKVFKLTEEYIFILKLLFYAEYMNINNIKTIMLPVLTETKTESILHDLYSANLIDNRLKGFLGSYYFLSKKGYKELTGIKQGGDAPLKHTSNATIEAQDCKHLYLSEMVIQNVNADLKQRFDKLSPDMMEAYYLKLFVKNISFDCMLALENREEFLAGLGYSEKEIKRILNLKTYSDRERTLFYRMSAKNSTALEYGKYYQAYKSSLEKRKNSAEPFEVFNFYFDYLRSRDINYMEIIENTVKAKFNSTTKEKIGCANNFIRYQTDNVRGCLNLYVSKILTTNGLENKKSEVLVDDKVLAELQEKIQIYNAIVINIRKLLKPYTSTDETKRKTLNEDEVPYYERLLSLLDKYSGYMEQTQKEFDKKKRFASFSDSQAALNSEDKPTMSIKNFEVRNVYISDMKIKTSKKNMKNYLEIQVVSIDRNTVLKNFKSDILRRNYYGYCQLLHSIGEELGITVVVKYTYCYPEGSNITNYEMKFDKIFKANDLSGAIKGADFFYIKELKKYKPYSEAMSELNKRIIY